MQRRRALAAMLGLATAPFVAGRSAAAAIESLSAEIQKVIGTRPLNPGRIEIEIPRLADNGHSVPLKITVQSPMSASDHVTSVTLLSERNPRPVMATFHFGPRAGKAVVSTRVRLNGTQRLLAIAQLSDGTCWSATAEVVVTESACLDDS
jgi:sulfur-oxidizing protein SoxY